MYNISISLCQIYFSLKSAACQTRLKTKLSFPNVKSWQVAGVADIGFEDLTTIIDCNSGRKGLVGENQAGLTGFQLARPLSQMACVRSSSRTSYGVPNEAFDEHFAHDDSQIFADSPQELVGSSLPLRLPRGVQVVSG